MIRLAGCQGVGSVLLPSTAVKEGQGSWKIFGIQQGAVLEGDGVRTLVKAGTMTRGRGHERGSRSWNGVSSRGGEGVD